MAQMKVKNKLRRFPISKSTMLMVIILLVLLAGLFKAWLCWNSYMQTKYPQLKDPNQAVSLLSSEYAGFTALFSAISFACVVFTIISQMRQSAKQAQFQQEQLALNLSPIINVELKISDIPTVLRFHGITKEQLAEAGVTEQELAYLAASFSAGRIYHEARKGHITTPFDETSESYRYRMCASPDTRKAWKLIRLMMNESSFVDRIQATINEIEEKEMELKKPG